VEHTNSDIGGSKEFNLTPRWTDRFPTACKTHAALSWESTLLKLEFSVQEDQIRALETDPWLVHRDSCVEFFFSLPGEEKYYNIEVNPVGVLLFAHGSGRNNRLDLTPAYGKSILVDGSFVGDHPFDVSGSSWSVELRIPREIFGYINWDSLADNLTGNLFKCGDGLNRPHYLSWAPLTSVDPDFHRPGDFVNLLG
jgi:hypothetical protein